MTFSISSSDFDRLAGGGYQRIPVVKTLMADMETPLSTYLKLAGQKNTFLFESVQGGEVWSRYSIVGLEAEQRLEVKGNRVTRFNQNGEILFDQEVDDPLSEIQRLHETQNCAVLSDLPVFHGGWVGYFSYDVVRYIEPRLAESAPADPLDVPDILLLLVTEVVVFDNLRGTLTLVVNADTSIDNAYPAACDRLASLTEILGATSPDLPALSLDGLEYDTEVVHGTSQEDFECHVCRIKDYILAGDVMQVVISHRMTRDFNAPPINLYRALRYLNPSPYLYFLNFDDFQVVGSSPEILVRVSGGRVTVRPIAGTIRRGANPEEDALLANSLLNDEKERAEHLMLIDLGRNDVGRVAKPGSVEVTENMTIEKYSHVMHIVSNVEGTLREGLNAIDTLKAALPAGTLSGAPKVRAMEIIDEIELVKRGVYGGAVGYLSWSGDFDTAIAIRTAVVKDQILMVQAGAGVVADSVPIREWQETMSKARAVLRAAAMASEETKH